MKRIVSLLLVALASAVAHAAPPVVTIALAAPTVPAAGAYTLNWSATGATSCTASATPANVAWSGTKAASGSAQVSGASPGDAFTLSCSTAGDLTAQLTWTAPIKNTDGSTLTDLAGYGLYWWQGAGAAVKRQDITSPGTLAFTTPTLAAGAWNFAIDAVNGLGTRSSISGTAVKTLVGPEVAAASVTVVKPQPPVLTIAAVVGSLDTPAYKYSVASTGVATRSQALAGFIAVGKPCNSAVLFNYRGKRYRQVAQADVRWESNGVIPSQLVAAPC